MVELSKVHITLSKQALEMLNNIRKRGSFRTDSQTIEESIRIIHSIIENPSIVNVRICFERLKVPITRFDLVSGLPREKRQLKKI